MEAFKPDHKHIIVSGLARTPFKEVAQVEDWLRRMVEAVGMTIMMGPFVERCDTPGNEGVTGMVVIETSHSSLHIWDSVEDPYFRYDLYSCKDFDPQIIVDFAKELDPYYVEYMLVDRNETIKVIEQKHVQYIPIIDLLPLDLQEAYVQAGRISYRKEKVIDPLQKKARAEYNKLDRKYGIQNARRRRRPEVKHALTLNSIKGRCARSGVVFELDAEWYADAVEKALQKYPAINVHSTDKNSFWSADVDRIDPTKGYTKNNSRIVPHALNVAKWNWSPEQLAELYVLIEEELNP